MRVQFKSITVAAIAVFALLFAVVAGAGMCHRYYKGGYFKMRPMIISSPVAYCTTGSGTNISMPAYSCCQLLKVVKKRDHYRVVRVWGNQWVGGGCANADPRAVRAARCGIDSPIYGTGMPIIGQCQFSYSTRS